MKKFMYIILVFLFIFCFTACTSSNKSESINVNNASDVFPELEGSVMSDYFKSYEVPLDANEYITKKGAAFDKIKAEVAQRTELIDEDGELDETFYFVEDTIQLVGKQWIYAYTEDGHVTCDLLIKFQLDSENKVLTKVCAKDYNQEGTVIVEMENKSTDTSSTDAFSTDK